ncbi:ABC transporter substrate-binding protein [Flavobacterium fluviatile]|uniref:ABC transporter substrate-binding protein n=1 Tax=Flavobacterium fluviatile TaxID=1862387 RepID=UPI0013D0EEFD|nr:ABC transporter substrate-binding protein [Flavobacterium fluviatile]
MQTIGILLARSTFYHTIGFDLYEGLRQRLKQLGRSDIKIVTENIGFGADKQQCYRSAEKLLLEENVSLVIAYIGHRTAQLLRPLFLSANKMLIVLDAGANLPQEWSASPNIFYHSLHNSLGAWLAAKQAVKDGYKNGGMVTGYYDGGYLQTFSISKGFEGAGGKICFNHATGYKKEDFTMLPLKSFLKEFDNTALLTLFSGDYMQWNFEEIRETINKNTPIYLSPFGFEETMLETAIHPNTKTKGVAAWAKSIKNDENSLFIETIESIGRTPNLFSLLSWESAQIALKVLDLLNANNNNILLTAQDLYTFEFDSPRGKIKFHAETNTSIGQLYNAEIIASNDGKCQVRIDEAIIDTAEEFETMTQLELDNISSAWHNSYTCI